MTRRQGGRTKVDVYVNVNYIAYDFRPTHWDRFRAGRGMNLVESTFTITELADEFDVTPRAIRFYEDKGLLSPRRNGMTRVYSHRDRARLILILRGKRVGFSLAEIKEMLDLYDVDNDQIEQARYLILKSRERIEALREQRDDIDQAMKELEVGCEKAEQHLRNKGIALHEAVAD